MKDKEVVVYQAESGAIQLHPDMNKMPKFRFKRRQGKAFPDWVEKEFRKFAKKVSDSYNPATSSENWQSVELESLGQGNGKILKTFSVQDLKSIKTKFRKDDVLFGKLRPYLRKFAYVEFDGVCTSEIWVLRANGMLGKFLYFVVQSNRFHQFALIQSGSKMPRSDWKIVSSARFLIPSLPEQQKIADFLSSVDSKIDMIAKKKDLLEQYKKGMMQKLFSKELRFKDAQEKAFPDWVEKRLGEVADVYQPETLPQSRLDNDGAFLVYGANGVIGRLNRFNHEASQVAVTCRGNTCGQVTFTKPKSWITGNSMIVNLDNSESVLKKYLYYNFKGTDWRYLITGSGQPQITGEIKKHKFKLPPLPEQQKIADFLSAIDRKIDIITTELTHTQTFKKGLLQQMFV